jgi:hypothetical protein
LSVHESFSVRKREGSLWRMVADCQHVIDRRICEE